MDEEKFVHHVVWLKSSRRVVRLEPSGGTGPVTKHPEGVVTLAGLRKQSSPRVKGEAFSQFFGISFADVETGTKVLTELVSYMYLIYVHHMYIFDVLSFPFWLKAPTLLRLRG